MDHFTISPTTMELQNYLPTVMFHGTFCISSIECRLPYTILDIKGFSHFNSLKKNVTQICLTLKSILPYYFLLFSLVSMNLTNYGKRNLKLFTICHISWDTLWTVDHYVQAIQLRYSSRDEFNKWRI